MNILSKIESATKERIAAQKRKISLSDLRSQVADLDCDTQFPFEKALRKSSMSFICEIKKASPSKGVIAQEFLYQKIAAEYESAGADAISVLTEPDFFQGKDAYLTEIRKTVSIPILRKDFTIDEYMIYQAKCLGADAILLICALLSVQQLEEYIAIAKSIGLSSLVEVHDTAEAEAARLAKASIIGVNNRSLQDFNVSLDTARRLRSLIPPSTVFVAESGLQTKEDIKAMKEIGSHGVLIGEVFMRSTDKKALLQEFQRA
ncbi:MAG: indole-3-glycerol phosphate synthase TrpC [Lachnospiraceae bacterium]|jgi:indole-3-glycerol phosphate synthase|nr:indole-3-glycerol phosphate synthase TrpC [Lachnospiraceae bacterium]